MRAQSKFYKVLLDIGEGKYLPINNNRDIKISSTVCHDSVDSKSLISKVNDDTHNFSTKDNSWLSEKSVIVKWKLFLVIQHHNQERAMYRTEEAVHI